ncbi:beta-phosphoglucomutase [Liberiplasma polymorphum]|uniref:beta-phosphoglucomutase n=1 Tax=Liberiplasma polymorphum TaxID=3374570 RepID=UPI00377466D6
MNNAIKLIIFDLDGVLTETSKQHFKAWQMLAKKHGIHLPKDFEKHLKGVSREDSLKRILDFGNKSTFYTEKTFNDMMNEKNIHYQSLIEHFTEKNLFKGAKSLLDLLKDKGLLLALGSASRNGPSLLRSLGIYHYFDYIVNPEGLNGKPSPDIFLNAMHHFKLTPDECIGIEDAIAGIKAIKNAKMLAVGIGNKQELKEADYVFDGVHQITKTALNQILKERATDDLKTT